MAIDPTKLTRGFGNGTFSGDIGKRVTQGFTISVVPKDIQIDGQNNKVLSTNYQSVTLYFNGSNYFSI